MKEKLTFRLKRSNKLPLILQDEIAECGHACVAMVSNYFGHQVDLFSLRKLSSPSPYGINLLDMIQLFDQLNLKARALQLTLSDLVYLKTPAILHWNMNHFVVVKEVKKVCNYS